MTKQYVFLVHGMGLMEAGWDGLFVKAIVDAMRNYTPYDTMEPDDIKANLMHFIPVSYDSVFEGYRKRWSKLTGNVADQISATHPEVGRAFDEFTQSAQLAGDWKDFFWTHLLDPLLWYTLPEAREAVVAHASLDLARGLQAMHDEIGTNKAHIVAHSQGTSVTHDSLVALSHYSDDEWLFKPRSHKWLTVCMIANVSRLLEATFTPATNVGVEAFRVYKSALAPGLDDTICVNYVNARHKIDPFTWPRQFRPVDTDDWPVYGYEDIEISRFRELPEVHDFDHYFADPDVHIPVLRRITPDRLRRATSDQEDEARRRFEEEFTHSASLELDELRDLFQRDPDGDLSVDDILMFLFKAYRGLRE